MRNLQDTLKDYDLNLLEIIAHRWDVDLNTREEAAAAKMLAAAMLNPDAVANEWERLKDNERGALQMVVASKGHKMPAAQFERLYGEIRQLGPDRRQREKPHLSPTGVAETLYYRGLLHLMFDEGKTGVQSFVFVPPDLAAAMPTHRAGYDLSQAEPDETPVFEDAGEPLLDHVLQLDAPKSVQKADTSLVDDLTTLLGYIQLHEVRLDQGNVPLNVQQNLMKYFVGAKDSARLDFMLFLGAQLELIDASTGLLQTVRANVRHWLEQNRTQQVKSLAESWHSGTLYNELWNIPTLIPEEAGTRNDPTLLRGTLHEMLQFVGSDEWISIEALIAEIKESEPDFQRPGGDYTGWYIRDRATGDYLQGFESWDQIEGATLYFAMSNPMYWLGLADRGGADEKVPDSIRLTAFGKAWTGRVQWPDRKDPETRIALEGNGNILIPRAASRYDRFQLARFTDWGGAGDTYTYTLTGASLKRADAQNIKPTHIQAFLQRTGGQTLPPNVQTLLEAWEAGSGASVVLERLLVLQVDTPEMMKTLWETPEIRRFLSRQLGPQAVVVRADQWEALVAALEQRGIPAEVEI